MYRIYMKGEYLLYVKVSRFNMVMAFVNSINRADVVSVKVC
jgi:hypothetical protein